MYQFILMLNFHESNDLMLNTINNTFILKFSVGVERDLAAS